jgi:hypothetical protein
MTRHVIDDTTRDLAGLDQLGALDARMRAIHELFALDGRIFPAPHSGMTAWAPHSLDDLDAVRAARELTALWWRWEEVRLDSPYLSGRAGPEPLPEPLPEPDRAAFERNDRLAAIAIAVAGASVVAGLVAARLVGMLARLVGMLAR